MIRFRFRDGLPAASSYSTIRRPVIGTGDPNDRYQVPVLPQSPLQFARDPASLEINASLPKIKLSENELGAEGVAECVVCMDDVFLETEVMSLPCKHWFHEGCAIGWLNESNSCPVCRMSVGVVRRGG